MPLTTTATRATRLRMKAIIFLFIVACVPLDADYQPDTGTTGTSEEIAATATAACCDCTDMADLANAIPGLESAVQRTPFDPLDPLSPGVKTVFGRPKGAPPPTLYNEHLDSLTFEQVNLVRELGLVPEFHADQLAQACEQGRLPPATVIPAIKDVLAGEISSQQGWYVRIGKVIIYHFNITWTNAVPGSDALQIEVELPFQAATTQGEAQSRGMIYPAGSQLRTQNGPIGTSYSVAVGADDTTAAAFSIGVPGSAVTQLLIGDGDVEGSRSVEGEIRFRTSGARSIAWPYVKVTNLIAAPLTPPATPSAVPGPAEINYIYDSALVAESVELYKNGAPLAPPVSKVVTTLPRGRDTFIITNTAQYGTGDYSVVFKGVESNSFTIDP